MKRFLAAALILSSLSLVGLVGCEQKTEDKVKETSSGPNGSTTKETTTVEKKTGDDKAPEPSKAP